MATSEFSIFVRSNSKKFPIIVLKIIFLLRFLEEAALEQWKCKYVLVLLYRIAQFLIHLHILIANRVTSTNQSNSSADSRTGMVMMFYKVFDNISKIYKKYTLKHTLGNTTVTYTRVS